MDLSKYFLSAPAELEISGRDNDLQLLKVFAYNAYYNADPLKTDDVNNGCCYRRDKYAGIDGVYLNETLDENTVECVFSYFVGKGIFVLTEIYNFLNRISAEIEDVQKKRFVNNKEADDLLREYFDDPEFNKKIIIRIITDYSCSAEEKYQLGKKVRAFNPNVPKLDVTVDISFGDDVKAVIESNRAPFDWVEKGKVILDEPDNFLKYKDHSIVCNISAKSLRKLWESDGDRGLLAMNLRYYIKSAKIDDKIENSILFDNKDFWYLNNGIIIVCNDYEIKGNEVILSQFSIVNGGQTSRMIGTIPFNDDFFICCKIIKNTFESSENKNEFISKVAEASNTQKPIKAKDIIANKIEQRNLKTTLAENKIFIEVKRGEKCNYEIYPEPWQRTKNNELAQDLYSFVFMQPGPARNSVSSILSNDDKYKVIFQSHSYSVEFLRDLLFLEKAYKEYQKKINKDKEEDGVDATKKGLVKNGLWYCLGTIGYILKLAYNPEFRNNIQKYRNDKTKYDLYSSELAFTNRFIDENLSYKDFKTDAFALFDLVFTQLLIPQFTVAKETNPSIAYSNWTKTNTGFDSVRSMINCMLFDNKLDYIVKAVCKYFEPIDDDTENKNIDTYVDYCKKNKKIVSKSSEGYELSPEDETLRNELMLYRFNKSASMHISESKVFNDKTMDRLIIEKPVSMNELKKIVGANTAYYCGDEILKIIGKYF